MWAVARLSYDPKKAHWRAAYIILEYMRRTVDLGLIYSRKGDIGVEMQCDLQVFVDAAYSSKASDRRSVLDIAVTCGGSPVAWFSRTQKCVTLSPTEAEYVAMGAGINGVVFVRSVLSFLVPGCDVREITVLKDNVSKGFVRDHLSSFNSKHSYVRYRSIETVLVTPNGVQALYFTAALTDQNAWAFLRDYEEYVVSLEQRVTLGDVRAGVSLVDLVSVAKQRVLLSHFPTVTHLWKICFRCARKDTRNRARRLGLRCGENISASSRLPR